ALGPGARRGSGGRGSPAGPGGGGARGRGGRARRRVAAGRPRRAGEHGLGVTPPGRRTPERTCVGCRATAAKGDLVRIVRSRGGEFAVDRTGRLPGRGAYLHRSAECVRRAVRRKALARSLRATLSETEAARLLTDVTEGLGEGR